jgi:hypothetical protein
MKKTDTQFQNQSKNKLFQGPNEVHKNTLKEKFMQEFTENFMQLLLEMVNQNV